MTMELDEAAVRARLEAATPGPWHWAGNTDTGEPYLATWLPGIGRCSVLSIGEEARKTTGREADRVRSDAEEFDLGDPEELVHDWATDRFGEPIKDPRLWFYTDLMADPARDHVVYEVAPDATSREDRRVYRADITGIRHPDAEFIAHARTDVERLLAALDEARAERDKAQRAAKTLGGIVEQNARMILDITGLHDWIDEDGDGDWGAIWENAYELLPRLRAAEAALAAVRALVGPANPRSATAGSAYSTGRWDAFAEVRAVLESEVEDGVFGDPEIHARLTSAALATPTTPENTTEGDRA